MLEDQLTPTPMVINVDNAEHVIKTSATDFKSEKRSSAKQNERIVLIILQATRNIATRNPT